MTSMRWKRHRGLIALIIIGSVALIAGFGDLRIAAITSSEHLANREEVTQDVPGLVDLFDDSIVHAISVSFDQAEYDDLIATYQEEGEKAYIEASVTIDGATVDSVGLRLKGNSTLMSLRRDGPFGDRDGRPGPPSECVPAEAMPQATPGAGGGAFGPPNGFGGNVSADDPDSLPWLISFDEFEPGLRYQGYADVAIRPVLASETMLNEAVALKLVGAAGEPTERAAYSSFTLNGGEAGLRLIVEVPGDNYAEANFGSDGVLYKALSTSRFAYLGDDPTLYETAFDQETRKNHQDLKPVIELLRWVTTATEEEFATGLADRVDVESLARYIALQELLDNFDDMAGPGQNYYLWYDLDAQTFTVLTWDLNLALSDFGGGPGGPGGDDPNWERIRECIERVRGEGGRSALGDSGGGRVMGGNALKERFLASPAFQDLYVQEYAAVYQAIYGGGQADAELDRLAGVVSSSGLIGDGAVENELAALRDRFAELAARGPEPAVQEDDRAPLPGS